MSTLMIVIGGLPGTGKTSLARGLAHALDAVHLRIDTIEQALRSATMEGDAMGAAGYIVGCGIAADNLTLGRTSSPMRSIHGRASAPHGGMSRGTRRSRSSK
jgi:predicted kinase